MIPPPPRRVYIFIKLHGKNQQMVQNEIDQATTDGYQLAMGCESYILMWK